MNKDNHHPRVHAPSELEVRIRKAFSEVVMPAPENIAHQTFHPDLEVEAIRDLLINRNWTEINYEFLERHYHGDRSVILVFLTPEAFLFFFPAFLLISLKEHDTADLTALSAACAFCPPYIHDPELLNHKMQRVEKLSTDQLTVTRDVFVTLQHQYGRGYSEHIDTAIERITEMLGERAGS